MTIPKLLSLAPTTAKSAIDSALGLFEKALNGLNEGIEIANQKVEEVDTKMKTEKQTFDERQRGLKADIDLNLQEVVRATKVKANIEKLLT